MRESRLVCRGVSRCAVCVCACVCRSGATAGFFLNPHEAVVLPTEGGGGALVEVLEVRLKL